jgi:hypothetical protein
VNGGYVTGSELLDFAPVLEHRSSSVAIGWPDRKSRTVQAAAHGDGVRVVVTPNTIHPLDGV